ncbi:MAG TPA: M1 family metallopeptidase [Gemmatimonadales bacterium]|nr:M1 family metallopeptidase [Gemmatimonadales bacterium]
MLALVSVLALSQQPHALPPQVGDTSPFRRLALPAATLIREGSGRPGPRYWQQRADYTIRVTLDTATHTVAGTETLAYTNNSPDTLGYLWLQLDQNIYRRGSRGAALDPADARVSAAGFEGGDVLEYVRALRRSGAAALTRTPLATTLNGTLLRVELDHPLAPGQVVTLELGYHFQVPEHGSDRMGRERFPGGWLYEIAQWYPRVAVYDDVRGWNSEQYLGQGEFYLEYGDFDVALTVPRSFVVAATGTLLNPAEVLTPPQRARLARAVTSDTTIPVLAKSEVGQPFTRPGGSSPTLTWHFAAKNVRDVAWAAAANFIWDASGYDGILIQALYPPESNADWARATEYARHSIKHYSEKWFRYPYSAAITVAGPVGGMEYPMIVFCPHHVGQRDLFGVTTHELGHQWFPMLVGSNERLYAWMDEGFNTFINVYSTRAFYHDTTLPEPGGAAAWARFVATGQDEPPLLAADRVTPRLLGAVEYDKPAIGLYLLRHHVLDDTTRFDTAFREYIRRWAWRHPTPADFFRTMDDALGEDLSWFWRGWFYRTDVVDQAVDSVRTHADSTGMTVRVFLASLGALPMPVDLRLSYANGTTEEVRLPVEIWFQGNRYVCERPVPAEVIKVEIDPRQHFPDVRRENNVWVKPR